MPVGPESLRPQSAPELAARLAAEREAEPFLIMRAGDGTQLILALRSRAVHVIGRDPAADIVLAGDQRVSRAHAELRLVGAQWVLSDDGLSRNGSYVNGERVAGGRRLQDGDVLRFGGSEILFRDPEHADPGTETALSSDQPRVTPPELRETLVELCRPLLDGTAVTPATNLEIAEALFVSVETVKRRLRWLFAQYGLSDLPQNRKRAELADVAIGQGVVGPHDVR